MDKKLIQTTNFNKAKEKLKKFSEEIPNNADLPTVETEGWFWFSHQVTGKELNDIIEKIQDCLITNNNNVNKIIKEFGQIYNALEALDKDYIQSILVSVKAAEEASNQAKKAAEEASKNNIDIKQAIEIQVKIIHSLKQFKAQINEYKNLKNIDVMWDDFQLFKERLSISNTKIASIYQEIQKDSEDIKELKNKVKIANILAGTSICMTFTLLILNIMDII